MLRSKCLQGIVLSRLRYLSTISFFIAFSSVLGGGQIELGMMKSLCERHIGHVLLVFFSSFSVEGFSGAVARQLRMHSSQVRYEWQNLATAYQGRMYGRNLQGGRMCLVSRSRSRMSGKLQ
jgi:hypothetical protein